MTLTDDEWVMRTPHPPRSPRGYAHLISDAHTTVVGYREILANDEPGSAVAAEDVREIGVSTFRLARLVVDAAGSGLISAGEAAACMGPDDDAFRAVRRRLWHLGCDCRLCAAMRERHRAPY